MAVILAFRTRKVTIKALNDSKQLTIIIYLSTIIITVMVICVPALNRFLNADAAVFGGLIMIFTTVVLALMFIPKVRQLYNHIHFFSTTIIGIISIVCTHTISPVLMS